jgi:hypothetical protein
MTFAKFRYNLNKGNDFELTILLVPFSPASLIPHKRTYSPPLSLKSDIADLTTKLNSRRKQKNKIN